MSAEPPADRRQLLVPVRSRAHPWGHVVAKDPQAGQLVRCPCGAERWTAYGQASQHGARCPAALVVLAERAERHGAGRAAMALRHQALGAALARAGTQGHSAGQLAQVLGYSAGHVRWLLRQAEAAGQAERRGRRPYRWRRPKAPA